jgi:hypothetical protein
MFPIQLLATRLILLPLLVLAVTSCSGTASPSRDASPSVTQSPEPTPTATASATGEPTPTASPTATKPSASGPVVVTFRVADEQEYRVLLTDADDIAIARQLLAGEEAPRIPNGRVVRDGDGGVNAGYGWHIDPEDVEFADVTIEVCDGLPSDVAGDPVSYQRFCPWSAEVVAVEDAPDAAS